MPNLSKAKDQERAEEARQSNRDGYEPVLTNSRWLLKLPENGETGAQVRGASALQKDSSPAALLSVSTTKLTTRKSYGFITYHAAETVLYHALGALPLPKTAHEFFLRGNHLNPNQ